MGLRDVTGVFSRYFIVGFFLPLFFSLLAIWISVGSDGIPSDTFQDHGARDQVLVLGGLALLAGLLLLGLRHPTWRLFQGVLSERLDLRWKTAFGASGDRYHVRGRDNWGLDVSAAWPLIAPFLNDAGRDLHVDLETDARLFVNGCIGSLGVAVYLVVDGLARDGRHVALALIPLAIAYLLYRGGVMTADRWGMQKLASGALHRFEVYERAGIPAEPDERAAGRLASSLVVLAPRPTPLKDLLRRGKRDERRASEPSVDPRA